jgi:amino acid transporter
MPESLSNSTQVSLNLERNHSYKIATSCNLNQDDGFLKKTKSIFFSKKKFDEQSIETTELSRVLTLKDLVFLGVSCTLGSGIYVLAGNVIGEYTGPAVLISFIVAGLCSFLSGLCYAELGSRVPRSGSAYVYIYVTIGEFIAFIIGWDVILEYVIGTSSTASMLSAYIDFLADNKISKAFKDSMPMNSPGVGEYPDFLAFGLCIFITGLLIVGVKESSFLNMIFTGLNILIILFIVIAGGELWKFNNIFYFN